MSDPVLSDEDLVAYLDGELDEGRRQAVDEALARDAGLRQRLDALTVDMSALRHAFDDLAQQAPPPPPFASARPQQQSRRFSTIGAALVGAALAASLTLFVLPEKRDGWRDYVASYQALYVDATLSHLDPAEADQRVELQRVAGIIGREIPFDVLTGNAQLDYKRAQVLGFEARPLVQLAFLSERGAPYALCIIRREEGAAHPVAVTRMEGLSTATWSEGDYAYMLIGGNDDALVEEAARRFAVLL